MRKRAGFISKKLVAIAIVIIVIASLGWVVVRSRVKTTQATPENQILAETVVEKGISFPALGRSGEIEGEVQMNITKAEKTKEVLVQGKPATAKGSKAFLVLNLEIQNADVEPRYITPVDLFRLVGDNDKKFAADVHSQIVEVQPISTKITRIGFVVEESQTVFNLQIGELEGDKEELQINF